MPKPSGQVVDFPTCAEWACTDGEHWDAVGPSDPRYSAVKREQQIALYHQPRPDWRRRLQQERAERNGGEPLWIERPDSR